MVSAIVFLFASILKHASHDIPRYMDMTISVLNTPKEQIKAPTLFGHNIIELLISFMAFFIFLLGLIYAQNGIFILSNIANHSMKRRPGYLEDVFPAESLQHRIVELDEIVAAR